MSLSLGLCRILRLPQQRLQLLVSLHQLLMLSLLFLQPPLQLAQTAVLIFRRPPTPANTSRSHQNPYKAIVCRKMMCGCKKKGGEGLLFMKYLIQSSWRWIWIDIIPLIQVHLGLFNLCHIWLIINVQSCIFSTLALTVNIHMWNIFILASSIRVFLSVSKERTLSRNTRISTSNLSLRSLAFCSSTISTKYLCL